MLLLAALAATTAAMPPQRPRFAPTAALRQASATVRIISGARVRFGGNPGAGDAQVRDGRVRERDGTQTTITMVEFP